jgi:hypothetical protein
MSKNTVFVIGAGASKEVNLPSGYELKNKIAELLDIRFSPMGRGQEHGDYKIVEAIRLVVQDPNGGRGDINPYLHEAGHICEALPLAISIDNFIDAHRDNNKIALCGKLAIARSILQAEHDSLLYFERHRVDSTISFDSLEKTWYLPFFQLLTENCGKNDLKERFQTVTLIIFNYDRCIEHFLYHALQNYYRVSDTEAADLVKNINIFHPYGSIGSLPWNNPSDSMNFGDDPSPVNLLQVAKKIKTFTEGTDPNSSEIIKIRSHMSRANRLVFIGFAFHKLNIQIINPEIIKDASTVRPKCYATTFTISESDKEVIRSQINGIYRAQLNIKMANLTCEKFFTEFWRSLSF